MNSRREHWEDVYRSKSDSELSWTQVDPRTSFALIREVCPGGGAVIDVGGGTSVLAARLLEAGYAVTVLDISAAALEHARSRLGGRADEVRWVAADVTADPDLEPVDVWHDRAVFHFLTEPADRAAYAALLAKVLRPRGHAIIATFAPDGPERCSGLPVCRYDGPSLADALGGGLRLLRSQRESHLTPWGKPQSFQYSVLRKRAD
jgi:SAM-dependent methyltransferase